MRFVELRGDVEELVIPEDLGPRAQARTRLRVALDIDEVRRPRRRRPGAVVDPTVDVGLTVVDGAVVVDDVEDEVVVVGAAVVVVTIVVLWMTALFSVL